MSPHGPEQGEPTPPPPPFPIILGGEEHGVVFFPTPEGFAGAMPLDNDNGGDAAPPPGPPPAPVRGAANEWQWSGELDGWVLKPADPRPPPVAGPVAVPGAPAIGYTQCRMLGRWSFRRDTDDPRFLEVVLGILGPYPDTIGYQQGSCEGTAGNVRVRVGRASPRLSRLFCIEGWRSDRRVVHIPSTGASHLIVEGVRSALFE